MPALLTRSARCLFLMRKMTQLLGDVRDPLPLTPKVRSATGHEYRRGGTRNLFIFVEPKAGSRTVLVTQRRGKPSLHRRCAIGRHALPRRQPLMWCWITSIPILSALVETFGKEEADRLGAARLCFHYTSPHGRA